MSSNLTEDTPATRFTRWYDQFMYMRICATCGARLADTNMSFCCHHLCGIRWCSEQCLAAFQPRMVLHVPFCERLSAVLWHEPAAISIGSLTPMNNILADTLATTSADVPPNLASSMAHSLAALECCGLILRTIPFRTPDLRLKEYNVRHNQVLVLNQAEMIDEAITVLETMLTSGCCTCDEDTANVVLSLLELYLDRTSYEAGYRLAKKHAQLFKRYSADHDSYKNYNALLHCFSLYTDHARFIDLGDYLKEVAHPTPTPAGLLAPVALWARMGVDSGRFPTRTALLMLAVAKEAVFAVQYPVRSLYHCLFAVLHLYVLSPTWNLNIVLYTLDELRTNTLDHSRYGGRTRYDAEYHYIRGVVLSKHHRYAEAYPQLAACAAIYRQRYLTHPLAAERIATASDVQRCIIAARRDAEQTENEEPLYVD